MLVALICLVWCCASSSKNSSDHTQVKERSLLDEETETGRRHRRKVCSLALSSNKSVRDADEQRLKMREEDRVQLKITTRKISAFSRVAAREARNETQARIAARDSRNESRNSSRDKRTRRTGSGESRATLNPHSVQMFLASRPPSDEPDI